MEETRYALWATLNYFNSLSNSFARWGYGLDPHNSHNFGYSSWKNCPSDGLDNLALLREAHDLPWPFLCLPELLLSFQLLWDTPAEAKASTIHYWRNKSQSSGQSKADQLKPAPT